MTAADLTKLLKDLAGLVDIRRERIEQVERRQDLPPETKRFQIAEISDEYRTKRNRLLGKVDEARDAYERQTHGLRATRRIDPAAEVRVERLLESTAPDAILEQAQKHGDAETVAALRARLLYWEGEQGFADAEGLLLACDRALVDLGDADARKIKAALEMGEAVGASEKVRRFAVLGTEPDVSYDVVSRARLEMAHALPQEPVEHDVKPGPVLAPPKQGVKVDVGGRQIVRSR